MKRNSINFIITIVLAVILSQFLPWWSVMVASFSSALLIPLKKASVFVVPLLAIALFWIVYSWSLSSANDFILAKKIAVLLSDETVNAEVDIIFQPVENLHKACPDNLGDWYFTGDYPTVGGNRVVNRAFINFYEGNKERAY